MGFDFELLLKDVDESYPKDLPLMEIAAYISQIKSDAFEVNMDEIIITSDTVVIINNELLGKPKDNNDAFQMLSKLNGNTHLVVTAVTLKSVEKTKTFSQTTKVTFSNLSDEQLWYYILNFKPFDKAGAYGIQDWIGMVGVSSIDGSYTNVMGLPTEQLHQELYLFM
ncbi:nucleotide-binding protein [Pedobacter psychrophilus]|uniref:Nucleoside triphosphate pyrophosphatase n=2 Tax=Pedobacter psychrophilus TaxID=1826909 RepID=A0A179DPH1_9SPHI|nr:nucleotide-binding protein [Pedobacter psychrophilus]